MVRNPVRLPMDEKHPRRAIKIKYGGQGGIRTHGDLAASPHFECGALDHYATCPQCQIMHHYGTN